MDKDAALSMAHCGLFRVDVSSIEDELLFNESDGMHFEFKSFFGAHDSPGHLGYLLLKACQKHGLKPEAAAVENKIAFFLPDEVQRILRAPKCTCRVGVLNLPPEYIDSIVAPYKICLYYWESDRLPHRMIEPLNKFDEVWVISDWNKEVFRNSGVNVPIHKIRVGVDPDEYSYCWRPRENFTFGLCGFLTYRKGADIACRAFHRAFSTEGDVRLEIKTRVNPILNAVKEPEYLNDTRISVIKDEWDVARMREWYGSLDYFVFPSRCEGLGLIVPEAAACGAIPIITDWSGLTEFHDSPFLKIPHKGLQDLAADAIEEGHWCIPDEDVLVEIMRMCYTARDEGQHRACSDYALQNWDVSNTAKDISVRLHRIHNDVVRPKQIAQAVLETGGIC